MTWNVFGGTLSLAQSINQSGQESHSVEMTLLEPCMLYLNNPNVASNDDTFSIPKTSTIRTVILSLLLRLDHPESADVQDVSATSSNDPS